MPERESFGTRVLGGMRRRIEAERAAEPQWIKDARAYRQQLNAQGIHYGEADRMVEERFPGAIAIINPHKSGGVSGFWDENKNKILATAAFAVPTLGVAALGGGAAAAGAPVASVPSAVPGASGVAGMGMRAAQAMAPAKGLGGFLKDNAMDIAGLGLSAYGAHQQGKASDQMFAEDKRRYDEERRRRAGAAQQVAPFVQGMIQQLQARQGR